MHHTVRVWDAPTRLFHWALVTCVLGLLVTSQIGGAAMPWHFRFGYSVLTLLLFRLVWGFWGGHWSRFASFVRGPRAIWRYLRGHADAVASVGHNPLGALSVLAMLAFLMLQVSSGLLSDDEISAAGPLTRHVSAALVNAATFYHKNIGKFAILSLVALHFSAIIFYAFGRRDNLVQPMITGDKCLSFAAPASEDSARQRLLALTILGICGALVAIAVAWLEA
ncbi:MAG: cytochrome B [Comamonadaceae bacterium CG1_02_60_18]|nr:MAG: cytochrome B [Comamonadaceae bacterium CG1_02_60_18]PIQ50672.1 MAG: cytochrome B [Comamonadaceae bacterium CG12_big_fil_rev_8_21_14_0_65_59_15]